MDRGTLNKVSATLVDPTGSITGVFWEEWVDCIQVDHTYTFTNMRVKKDNYTNELFVKTAKEDFKVVEVEAFTEELPPAEASVLQKMPPLWLLVSNPYPLTTTAMLTEAEPK